MTMRRFVGTWRIRSAEFQEADGAVSHPWGSDPIGIVVYDAGGNMTVQLMRRERPSFASGDLRQGTVEETAEALLGITTYFGTYEVDESRSRIVHHVEGSSFPNWEGADQARSYHFDGDLLTLRTPPLRVAGEDVAGVLVWQRLV